MQMALIAGHATPQGTAAYASRFPAPFYRRAQGLTVSTLGIGSYLGQMNDAADAGYTEAVAAALHGGINFIDTSLNYRHQRSERNIGAALQNARREELVLCTKAGFLTPDAVPVDKITAEDVVDNMHCMTPDFLEDQLHRSRINLGVECVDVFYLHNPETQLDHVEEGEFYHRIGEAFARLERLADAGLLQYYGAATWSGFRQREGGLSLARMLDLAYELRGDRHRFRFIQLPFNLAMTEALSLRDAVGRNLLDEAQSMGISVVASASILQARLARDIPPVIGERLTGLNTDAQRSIQFTRSTPGITTALVGMGRAEHVRENLGIAAVPPATPEQFMDLFR
jgi:aryl-alcohol dehydrogenase-like predicted oxidoreductase